MRGKDSMSLACASLTRITPAYAGKRASVPRCRLGCRDHPRLCGEKKFIEIPEKSALGSPPPMRGKVVFHMKFVQHHRITPAYAGKRSGIAESGI